MKTRLRFKILSNTSRIIDLKLEMSVLQIKLLSIESSTWKLKECIHAFNVKISIVILFIFKVIITERNLHYEERLLNMECESSQLCGMFQFAIREVRMPPRSSIISCEKLFNRSRLVLLLICVFPLHRNAFRLQNLLGRGPRKSDQLWESKYWINVLSQELFGNWI